MNITEKIRCPRCGRSISVRLNQMYPGNVILCSSCRSTINFQGDDMRKAQQEMDKFERQLKRMFK